MSSAGVSAAGRALSSRTDKTTGRKSPIADVSCVIDRDVLNSHTYPDMTQVGLSLFAPLCGRNRGVFVTNPSNGSSYGCAALPPNLASSLDIDDSAYPIVDTNAIDLAYKNGTITSADVVDVLDVIVQSIYNSSGAGVSSDIHACDVSGLTTLLCPSVAPRTHPHLRAVTLAGVLSTSTPWVTNGKPLSEAAAELFYSADDFDAMSKMGLNTVQIPVTSTIFTDKTEKSAKQLSLLSHLMSLATDHHMDVILCLEVTKLNDSSIDGVLVHIDETKAAATLLDDFIKNQQNAEGFTGLILPSMVEIAAARQVSVTLPLFVPMGEGILANLNFPVDPNLFVALDMTHTTGVADIASSTSLDDRLKLYYHENLACQKRAPIQFAWCFHGTPVYVFKGFNLAIDNCVDENSSKFDNYGQCDRWEERVDSHWWHEHLSSFASRQLAGYETGMGWTFDAWKLKSKDDPDTKKSSRVSSLDRPGMEYALSNVVAAGLFPSLQHTDAAHYKKACLNNPMDDFVLGDDTLAPTPGPPPDCGNGWWNFETLQCDYWIPPTPCPTFAEPEPYPVCNNSGFWSPDLEECSYCPTPMTKAALVESGLVGGAVGLVMGALIVWLFVKNRGKEGYTEIPNGSMNV